MRTIQVGLPRSCSAIARNTPSRMFGRQLSAQQQQQTSVSCPQRAGLKIMSWSCGPSISCRMPFAAHPQQRAITEALSRQHMHPWCSLADSHGQNSSKAMKCKASVMDAAAASTATKLAAAADQTATDAGNLADIQQLRGQLQLYNTMSRKKEHFKPRSNMGDKVQMYVCGVTVYDYSHIGHARVYVAFDVLYRLLRHLKYEVQYVRNFTDVDDKIINRAAESGEDPLALSARFIEEFHKDMADLGCLPPTDEPKATDYISSMVDTIQRIIENGHGYSLPEGDVYFDVNSLPGYGRLSGRSQEDNRAGERVAVDSRKRSPADFALWKAAKPGEPSWPSPWGQGRPGWHIECSSMISQIMGDVIDIHGGGRDLVFPHHENELAQSQAAAGPCSCGHQHDNDGHTDSQRQDFVRYWLHNGFVKVDSEKMSKSLGNFFTIRDVLKLYHPLALRWFLVNSQYRAPVNYTQKALDDASDRSYYVYHTLAEAVSVLTAAGKPGATAMASVSAAGGAVGVGAQVSSAVVRGLLDDLNTPVCISELSAPLKALNDLMTTKAGKKNPKRLQLLAEYVAGLTASLQLLGLAVSDINSTLTHMRELALARAGLTQEQVEEHIAARAAARAAKDFAAADAVRLGLASLGILLMDTPTGTTWRPGLQDDVA